MDSDRDFAKIEKEVRCQQNIYSVDQYHDIMVKSQAKTNVVRLSNMFVEFKKLPGLLGLVNRTVLRNGTKVYFKDFRWIYVDTFGSYKFKLSHRDDEPWETEYSEGRQAIKRVRCTDTSQSVTKVQCETSKGS